MGTQILRSDLQKLTRMRVREAKALLEARKWAGAAYLVGYSVECALKACIAKSVSKHQFPDKQGAAAAWVHDLKKLVIAAELEPALEQARQADPLFRANWDLVAGPTGWNERRRYQRTTKRGEALAFYNAITDPQHGILTWIANYW